MIELWRRKVGSVINTVENKRNRHCAVYSIYVDSLIMVVVKR